MSSPALDWKTLVAGATLPSVVLEVTEQTVILVPVSTWDLFPGHHSPAYARAQGRQDMYLNTVALQGIADRAVTDALGLQTWVVRRKLSMVDSVYPGDVVTGAATATQVRTPTTADPSPSSQTIHGAGDVVRRRGIEADFTVEMSTARGLVLRAEITACCYHHEGAS